MSCIEEMLAAGVDGIDFRIENHGTHTDYEDEYGYNEAVLAECARRGSRDAETIAKVRGEAYTKFLRKAKALVASRGKQMRINLNIDWFRPDPPPPRRLAYPLNIDFEWRRWVEEGLLDEGILRLYHLPFDSIFSDPVAAEMIAKCEGKGIPLVVNRYINPGYPEEFARVLEDKCFSGFVIYEAASFLRFQDPPGCTVTNEVVRKICEMAGEKAARKGAETK